MTRIEIKSLIKSLYRLKDDMKKTQNELENETQNLVKVVLNDTEKNLMRLLNDYNIPLERLPEFAELSEHNFQLSEQLEEAQKEIEKLKQQQGSTPQTNNTSGSGSSSNEINELKTKNKDLVGLVDQLKNQLKNV